ncbi:MAG: XRE family transcriptional regulator [Puniceicoccales bacterium]
MTTEELSVMSEPEQYIFEEWDSMCARANKNLHGDCPLVEDEVLVEMHKYVHNLRAKVAELEAGSEAVEFTCHGNSAPAYSCNKPGDMSGTYYTTQQPVKVPEDLVAWKCEILDEIASDIYRRRYGSQAETAKILGITQPRVSAIANRRYEDFSLEAALTYKAMLAAKNN